jgi:hypothetical protein
MGVLGTAEAHGDMVNGTVTKRRHPLQKTLDKSNAHQRVCTGGASDQSDSDQTNEFSARDPLRIKGSFVDVFSCATTF